MERLIDSTCESNPMSKEEIVDTLKTMVFGIQAFERFNAKEREALDKSWNLIDQYENRLKKGKWIAHRKSNGEVGYFQCTSCDHHSVVKFPYCPICGAEMDCNPNILSEMKAIPKDQYEARLKADMVAMLTDIKLEIEEIVKEAKLIDKEWANILHYSEKIIQQKIDALKMN